MLMQWCSSSIKNTIVSDNGPTSHVKKIRLMSEAIDNLSSQQCSDLPADDRVLEQKDIICLGQDLNPPWQFNAEVNSISHTYSFNNYYQTMAFVNVIAQVAHQQDHHPELTVSYNRCTVSYTTHSVGGLSKKDFICAAKINAAKNL
jgi:4a-hydroxytetrahydrobiopterin dehydratase